MTFDEIAQWIGIPSGLMGLGLPLVLFLRRIVMLTSDHEARVAAQQKTCDDKVDALKSTHAGELKAKDAQLDVTNARLSNVVADRDAWREASSENAAARAAAERASAALMETGQLSLGLLAALKDVVASSARPRPDERPST